VSADTGLLDPLASPAVALVDDDAVLSALIEAEEALTRAWAELGQPAIIVDLGAATIDHAAIAAGNRAGGNPVIPLVTQLRAHAERLAPGAGDWVHHGATSQDILDTALMLVADRAIQSVSSSLERIADALAELADAHRHDLMVGRTLTQHAAPITFGVKAANWLDRVLACRAAIADLSLPVQLAGAVGTGSAFADLANDAGTGVALRAAFARRLGLADPGRSWQAERSPIALLASAVALTIGSLGGIAADLLVLARPEIAEVSQPGGGSSAMPQKQNPTTAILIRSAALQAPGLLATVFGSLAGEDERPAGSWHAEWLALRSLLRLGIEAAEATLAVTGSLVVDIARMRTNLDLDGARSWAEHAQSQLTPALGREAASVIVARALAAASPEKPFATVLLAELGGQVVDLSDESVWASADIVIDSALARHSTGGPQ
jgi:3-carboxy-cis,cis-muconate cycloisomerase